MGTQEPDEDFVRFRTEPVRIVLTATSRSCAELALKELSRGCWFTPYSVRQVPLWRKIKLTFLFLRYKRPGWTGVHINFPPERQQISDDNEMIIDQKGNGDKWPFILESFSRATSDKIPQSEFRHWGDTFACWGMTREEANQYLFEDR